MKISLTAFGYWQDNRAKIWTRPGVRETASAAQRLEERISAIVHQARDISLFSPELQSQLNDWPTRYHLGACRANILRPFQEQLPGADVLEIGAGCGAITRFLGESGANVTALEGGSRRASIARARTRDLANVEVISSHFDDYHPGRKFDLVTLIGVLDYAATFPPCDQPALGMIERAREMLKPGGRLIIAVENQLGSRSFAGIAEDQIFHSAHGPESGFEDREPRTYGRSEMVDLVRQAGFSQANVLAPFPNYRFPVSIITESGFASQDFNSAALASEWVGQEPDLTAQLTSAPALGWPIDEHDGAPLDHADSFLVVATESARDAMDPGVLAYHYPAHRSADYCKEITYVRTEGNAIELRVSVLETHAKPRVPGTYRRFRLLDRCDYVQGTPLSSELTGIVTRDGWTLEEVGSFIDRYLEIAAALARKTDRNVRMEDIESQISGRHFDLIPKNIILGLDGEFHPVDQEWDFSGDISPGLLIFRSLIQPLYSRVRFGRTRSQFNRTRLGFVRGAFRAAGLELTEDAILSYAKLETASQSSVVQRTLAIEEVFAPNAPLPCEPESGACGEVGEHVRLSEEALAGNFAELQTSTAKLRGIECSRVQKWTTLLRRLKPGRPGTVAIS